MTDEVTIRGRVLPIGGLKEKLLAAKQAGVKTVLIPEKNVKDLNEVPEDIKAGLDVRPCAHIEEVLKIALDLNQPEKFMQVVGLTILEDERSRGMEVAN